MARYHKTVLVKEAIEYLNVERGKRYIDATLGGGGHSLAILKSGGLVLGIDCDPEAIKAARKNILQACPPAKKVELSTCLGGRDSSYRLAQGNFRFLKKIAQKEGFSQVAGIIFDFGVSSHQLDTPERGFSFNLEGPLDMRMDPNLKVTAADLVNGLSKGELCELFSQLGQEKYSRRFANAIDRARRIKPIKTCRELSQVIIGSFAKKGPPLSLSGKHPATKAFMALRMAVNQELDSLNQALGQSLGLIKSGGRLVVISFHSGEDKVVKNFFKEGARTGKLKILTKKPLRPSQSEVRDNPRSRSARLRVAQAI
ncbi:16S rRNA (cytosine(1402)-N(4))-methyltransferase RsmH [Patescibacteria group bacterium]